MNQPTGYTPHKKKQSAVTSLENKDGDALDEFMGKGGRRKRSRRRKRKKKRTRRKKRKKKRSKKKRRLEAGIEYCGNPEWICMTEPDVLIRGDRKSVV